MPYTPVPAAPFSGGLNLRDSYEVMQPSQAYDLLNVTFDERGGVRQRPGFSEFAPKSGSPLVIGEATNRFDSLGAFYTTGGTKHLVCGAGSRLEVYDTTGASVTTARTTGVTTSPHFFCRFGGPTSQFMFVANGTDTIQRWDGTNWANGSYTGGFTPDGMFLAVTPWDNRLVNARMASNTAGGDNRSTVRFSDPSSPLAWQTDNWVDVVPGDGESIMGMCSFDNYVIVFKESRFFVFYGTTINAEDGSPEFNYRAVEASVGLAAPNALCVAPDGVYFLAQDGIYKTNGGYPAKVSELVEPLFFGEAPDLYSGSTINWAQISKARMAYLNGQVFLAVPTGSASYNDRLLVFDVAGGWWTAWDIPAAAITPFKIGANPELVFAYGDGYKRIGRVQEGLGSDAALSATDSGDIFSFVKTAFNELGSTVHKSVRESQVWGSGQIRFALTDDFGSSVQVSEVDLGSGLDKWADGNDASDTWGDGTGSDLWARQIANKAKLVRKSVRGAYVSMEIYNSSASPGAWRVSRVIHHVREQRIPSVTRLDGE